ncbi:MAG TPA: hypothetical protein PLY93_12075, partial [Turneriella sp.]|nr:hypothetical protein [Turneriella sp.]
MRAAAGVLLIVSSLILNACGGRSSSPTALVTDENGLTTIATDDFPSDFALTLTQVTVTGNDATVEFTTGVEARVWIEYGKNSYTENKRTAPTTGVTHTLTLTALEKGRYFFKIGAVSLDDTQKSAWGGNLDASFLIASASLAQISNIQTTTQGEATTITFNTDIAAQASIDVGLTTAYDLLTESESGFTKTHSITVSLPQMGTFYYRIRLVDDAGDTKTDDNAGAGYTFTRANSEPLGSKLNPIVIDTTPLASNTVVNYNHSATTTGAASNYISSYAPYTNAGSYAAPEV